MSPQQPAAMMATWAHTARHRACAWRKRQPTSFYGTLLMAPVAFGWGLLTLTTGTDGESTPHQHLRTSPAEFREARRRAAGIEELLVGLGAKSVREKLEAAHDGATRTHEIGFGTDESSVRRRK